MFLKQKFGYSMVEVLVSSMIFMITMTGVISTFSAIRKPSAKTEHQTAAAYLGKRILDELRTQVTQKNWPDDGSAYDNAGPLDPSSPPVSASYQINKTNYKTQYVVSYYPAGCGSGPDPSTCARRVDLSILWDEP